MNIISRKSIATVAAAALLVVGIDAASYAATGDSLILGKVNHAGKTTTISRNGGGSALKLVTGPGSAPLQVTSSKKVTKLNADKVDGHHADALRNRAIVLKDNDTTTNHGGLAIWTLNHVPAGKYNVAYHVDLAPTAGAMNVVCGFTRPDFSEQFAADHMQYDGSWIAVWQSGATTMHVNTNNLRFFCQTLGGSVKLKNPLTLSFTPLDQVTTKVLADPTIAHLGSEGLAR